MRWSRPVKAGQGQSRVVKASQGWSRPVKVVKGGQGWSSFSYIPLKRVIGKICDLRPGVGSVFSSSKYESIFRHILVIFASTANNFPERPLNIYAIEEKTTIMKQEKPSQQANRATPIIRRF